MGKPFQIFHGIALAMLIALTSVSMSLARGHMRDASGVLVLCTGTGPVSVTIGSDGEPIGPMPICPDCAFSFLELLSDLPTTGEPALVSYQAVFAAEALHLPGISPVLAKARGPPMLA